MFKTAALQIVFELALHVRRQCALTRRQMFYERRVVLRNELIQECLLGSVPGMLARTRNPSTDVLAGH